MPEREKKQEQEENNHPSNPLLRKEGRESTTPALEDSPSAQGSDGTQSGTSSTKGDMPNFSAWQLAWELGYTIAIPIVVLALAGRWVDKVWGTSPWLLLAGIVVSIFISSALVYRKVKRIM